MADQQLFISELMTGICQKCEHVVKENHVIDWNSARIVVRESDWRAEAYRSTS